MSLTISQIAEIGIGINETDQSIAQGKESIEQNKKDKQTAFDKNETHKLFFDDENAKADSYQTERRWLDGTTHTPITYTQVDAAAQRQTGNIFFPADWTKFPPKLPASGNGNPTSNSTNDESEVLNASFDSNGLQALINFLQDSQSGVSDTLRTAYSGGTTVEVDDGGQTPGKYLLVYGSGNSALLKVVSVDSEANPSPPPTDLFTVNVTVVIATDGTIPIGGTVTEAFTFTNAQRNDPSTSPYENVLNGLFSKTETRVNLWNTTLTNQLTQLNGNLDTNPDIATAITDAENAQTVISTWLALPDIGTTGSDSKYTDNNLADLEAEVVARNAFIPARASQIVSALGTVSQDSQGKVSGNGIYKTRFETIGMMINGLDGPLAQFYNLDIGASVANVQIDNAKTKKRVFSTKVLVTKFSENPTVAGPTVKVVKADGFAISDKVVVVGTGLENIVADIVNVSGNDITLSKDVPIEYNADANAGLAKAK